MRKVLKWVGIVLSVLVGLLVLAVAVLYGISSSRLNRTYRIQPADIAIPTDPAALQRGRHLAEAVTGCAGCHGDNLGGKVFIDDPQVGRIFSANLTAGTGGIGATYADADWVRAIRHGVGPDGKLLLMPPDYSVLSDEDLGAIIAYAKSVPPVDNVTPGPKLTFIARLLFAVGAFGKMPAEKIDHAGLRPAAPQPGITAEYGGYLVSAATCGDCHGPKLSGGRVSPSDPFAPNLTPGGTLARWTEADFITTMRTGVTPDEKELSPEYMPWRSYARMSDEELKALWLYLRSLPAAPTTGR